ncbi:MAG: hypothetical protein MJZ03_03965 [archaeon]|nr:hypothetical protein [archaeon]
MTPEEKVIEECEKHLMTQMMDVYETCIIPLDSINTVTGVVTEYFEVWNRCYEAEASFEEAYKIIKEVSNAFWNFKKTKEGLK